MGRRKTIDREKILDAAEDVTLELGAARLTLDAVAKRASISKGGLVYCFSSKEDLIRAMFQREMQRFEQELQKELSLTEGCAYPRLLARILASKHETPHTRAKGASIIATISQMPECMDEVRQAYARDFASFDRSTPEGRAAVLALVAIEGAFLVRGLNLIDLPPEEWSDIFDQIARLIPDSA